MAIFACPDEDLIWQRKEIPSPLESLGPNLAVWFEARSGTGPGPAVTTWVNKVANGNAIQTPHPTAPVLVQGAFGRNPGVSFVAADAGLEVHLTTPFAIGDRPYMWCYGKLNQLVHTPGEAQLLVQALADPFVGGDEFEFDAEASGTFDVNSYWNQLVTTQETFITLPPAPPPPGGDALLLGPHTIQVACQQVGAMVIDGRSQDAPAPVPALANAINRIDINRAVVVPGSPGFWTLGVLVFSFTQPTAAQIANVAEYCANYATVL